MRLKTPIALAAAFAAGAAVMALRPRPAAPDAPPPLYAPAGAELALQQVVPEVRFEGVPLDEAVRQLSQISGAEIVPDWDRIALAGGDRKAPVRYWARRLPLGDALEGVLRSVDADDSPALTYWPEGGRIRVAAGGNTPVPSRARVYDVHDLLAPQNVAAAPPGPPVVTCFGPFSPEESSTGDALVTLLQEVVDPDSWRDSGGSTGVLRLFAGRLVAVQTWENHRLLGRALAQLREPWPEAAPPGPAPEVMVWDERRGAWASGGDESAEKALRQVIPRVRVDAPDFARAVAALDTLTVTSLWVDERALAAAGFDASRPVSLRLDNVTLAAALDKLLKAAAAGGLEPTPDFSPEGDVVTISARDAVAEMTLTRTYDVRDLRDRYVASVPAGPEEAQGAVTDVWEAAADGIVRTLQDHVDPNSWRDNGGMTGAARVLGGWVIVTQTWRNHEKVARLINAVRTDPDAVRAKKGD